MERTVVLACVQAHRGDSPAWLGPEAEVPAPRQADALRWATAALDASAVVHRDAMEDGCPELQSVLDAEKLVDLELDGPAQAESGPRVLHLLPSEQRDAQALCRPDEDRSAGRSFLVAAFGVEQEPLAAPVQSA